MKRLEYADYAKALAIFLVVLGHTQGAYLPGKDWMYQDFCYAFHMPLFFMLAGFFVRTKAKYSAAGWCEFLRRNFLALMVPYFIWGIIYMPFSYAHLGQLAYGSWLQLRDIGTLTSLWFLPAMFVGRVACEAVHTLAWKLKLPPRTLILLAVPLLFALGFGLPHHNAVGSDWGNFWQCDIGLMAAAYMLVGALIRPLCDRLANEKLGWITLAFALSTAAFAAGFLLERPLLTAGRDMTMLMCNAEYGPWAWCLANALTGSVMTLAFAMLVARIWPKNRAFLFVGANTMGVYLIHKPLLAELLQLSTRCGLPANDLPTALPATCAAFLVSLAIVTFFLKAAPSVFGKATTKGLSAGDVLAVAFGSDGTLAALETKTLKTLLAEFSRKFLADGKVDLAESEVLLNFITPIAERRGGDYATFRDLLIGARADGTITADESAALAACLHALAR